MAAEDTENILQPPRVCTVYAWPKFETTHRVLTNWFRKFLGPADRQAGNNISFLFFLSCMWDGVCSSVSLKDCRRRCVNDSCTLTMQIWDSRGEEKNIQEPLLPTTKQIKKNVLKRAKMHFPTTQGAQEPNRPNFLRTHFERISLKNLNANLCFDFFPQLYLRKKRGKVNFLLLA